MINVIAVFQDFWNSSTFYSYRNLRDLTIEEFTWNKKDMVIFPDRIKNLQGMQFPVLFEAASSGVIITVNSRSETIFGGFMGNIFSSFAEKINARLDMSNVNSSLPPNSAHEGVINGTIEMANSEMMFSPELNRCYTNFGDLTIKEFIWNSKEVVVFEDQISNLQDIRFPVQFAPAEQGVIISENAYGDKIIGGYVGNIFQSLAKKKNARLDISNKLILFGLAFVALAAGQQYLPPSEEPVAVQNEYLPPKEEAVAEPEPQNEYLPPVEELVEAQPEPDTQYLAPIEAVEPIEQIAEDGYRYKTVKRIRYRTRRDVSELTSGQYLPPSVEDSYGPPPSGPVQQSAELADDGYRYRTVKRIRYRHRRDVNELASAQYLPPAEEDDSYSYPAPAPVTAQALVPVAAPAPIVQAAPVQISAPAPIQVAAPAPVQISAPAPVQQSAELADDGYRYKTVRRIRYRLRRDVNELASGQYLPPAEEEDSYSYPQSAELADDGYRYKTVRRIRYRHRRDVNELSSGQYLPPAEEEDIQISAPAPAPIQQSAELADDGYRYKTVRRIRYRHRRDVNELSSNQYLPPAEEDDTPAPAPVQISAPAPVQISAPAPVQQSAELADDGYRYKTVRRIRYRHRRDVNELSSNQYLPPAEEEDSYSYPAPAPVSAPAPIVQAAPVQVAAPAPIQVAAPAPAPVQVAAPAPVQISAPAPVQISAPAPIQQSAELADDGYRYKTVRRIRYRHRRDVNELSAQYLPPAAAPAPVHVSAPAPIQHTAELADDGYRYKTVRKYKIKRH
ncbi:uncharacterized protein LOC129918117 [Episyrphus balteatus]|uniref:uncharacterized protein LOC129918117 n=1 Tax=Episyrphus balteatus TaxID=286459 RepID=UPI0024867A80|nr:uncharacterized protein LOC129918117 [Episyrphus balteatus]